MPPRKWDWISQIDFHFIWICIILALLGFAMPFMYGPPRPWHLKASAIALSIPVECVLLVWWINRWRDEGHLAGTVYLLVNEAFLALGLLLHMGAFLTVTALR